jgi:hypothetical protein
MKLRVASKRREFSGEAPEFFSGLCVSQRRCRNLRQLRCHCLHSTHERELKSRHKLSQLFIRFALLSSDAQVKSLSLLYFPTANDIESLKWLKSEMSELEETVAQIRQWLAHMTRLQDDEQEEDHFGEFFPLSLPPLTAVHVFEPWMCWYELANQEPILQFLNLQLQRQRCSRLERFSK